MTLEEVAYIMTWIDIVIKIACILLGVVFACAVTIPSLIKSIKARKAAKTEEEKAKADLDIQNQIATLVSLAEKNYASLDVAMKKLGESAGQFKKEKVMSDLRDFCDEKGYAFEKQKLSESVDKYVANTKEVNVK